MHKESIQGFHAFFIHNPTRDIDRIWQIRRADGLPRWHKVVVMDDKCDFITQVPQDTNWVIRHYPLSEDRPTTVAQAKSKAADAVQHHLAYALDAKSKGVAIARLTFEGINEWQPSEHPDIVNAYETTRIIEADKYGLSTTVFNIGVGQPPTYNYNPQAAANWSVFEPIHYALVGSKHYLGIHAYHGLDGPNALWGNGDMKWPQEGGRHLQCPWDDVNILITESGADDGVNGNAKHGWHYLQANTWDDKAQAYLNMLAWCEQQYLRDPRIIAVMPFTMDYGNNEWESFDNTVDVFWNLYAPYIKAGVEVNMWGDSRTSRWQSLVEYRAGQYNLDPRVVATVMAIESGGDVFALSSAGAVGLMQVMPDTYITGRPSKEVLYNPDQNMKWGCLILREAMNYFNNDLAYALAAYNAGIGSIAQHGIDWDAPRVYLGMFRTAWGQLWPGQANPLDGGSTVDEAFRQAILAKIASIQVIQLNVDAALQKVIFHDGFVPVTIEDRLDYNGVRYALQGAEHLSTGEHRGYYCPESNYNDVKYVTR